MDLHEAPTMSLKEPSSTQLHNNDLNLLLGVNQNTHAGSNPMVVEGSSLELESDSGSIPSSPRRRCRIFESDEESDDSVVAELPCSSSGQTETAMDDLNSTTFKRLCAADLYSDNSSEISDSDNREDFHRSESSDDPDASYGSSLIHYHNAEGNSEFASGSSSDALHEPDPVLHMTAGVPPRKKPKRQRKSTSRRPRIPQRRKSSSSDCDSENSDCQELSIHRILINNHPDNKIREIMRDRYKTYKEEEGAKIFEQFNEDDRKHFTGNEFKIRVFVNDVVKRNHVLQAVNVTRNSATQNSIIFLYRDGKSDYDCSDLFALTTGQAWNVVQKHSDFDFPIKVSARLLSDKGAIETASKVLVGKTASLKKTNKAHELSDPFDIFELCTTFTAALRDTSSIRRLSCLKKQDVKVTVGLSYVRFRKKFEFPDILSILDHLAIVAKDQPTCEYSGENSDDENPAPTVQEKETKAHDRFLLRVSVDMNQRLNSNIANMIENAVAKDNPAHEIYGYSFCHKNYEDYFKGSDFTLWFKQIKIHSFSTPPSIAEVMAALRNSPHVKTPFGNDDDKKLKQIRMIKFTYKPLGGRGEKKRRETILDYIEGVLPHRLRKGEEEEPKLYWHIMSYWCHIRDNYISRVHLLTLALLERHLLGPDMTGFLHRKWDSVPLDRQGESVRMSLYFRTYIVEAGYFIPEDNSLFDMLYVAPNGDMYIYYGLIGFDYSILNKAKEIVKRASKLKYIRSTSMEAVADEAKLITVFNANRQLQERFSSFSDFSRELAQLNGSNLVLAIVHTSSDQGSPEVGRPSFQNEKQLENKITSARIIELLQSNPLEAESRVVQDFFALHNLRDVPNRNQGSNIAEYIHSILRGSDYIALDSVITTKLLLASEQTFHLQGLQISGSTRHQQDQAAKYIFDKIIKPHQSHFPEILPKIILQETMKQFEDMNWKSCLISEIEPTSALRIKSFN